MSIGIKISDGPSGTGWICKYLDVLRATPEIVQSEVYFIVDNDDGKMSIDRHIKVMNKIDEKGGFVKLQCGNSNIFLILLPDGKSVEFLFDEYMKHLEECVDEIWDSNFAIKENTPSRLSRVVAKARKGNLLVENRQDAIKLIKNEQDVKDPFWTKVETNQYRVSSINEKILHYFLNEPM